MNTTTLSDLKHHFQMRGYQPHKPILIALDADNTIIDREKGSHALSPAVVDMFRALRKNSRFIVAMNTGRDVFNYGPIQKQTGHEQPNIFLSGRVIRYQDHLYVDQKGVFSVELKNKLWDRFIGGEIPFLDVKHPEGNMFFVQGSRVFAKYYGHHRPSDWFNDLPLHLIDIDTKADASEIFKKLKILRVEMPIARESQNADLLEAINVRDQKRVQELTIKMFNLENGDDLLFVPAPTNSTRGSMTREIGSVRILTHDRLVNKGTGLHLLAELLQIEESNVVYIGDSAGDKTNDTLVKTVMPNSALMITDNGDEAAKRQADFIINSVRDNGVPQAIDMLTAFQRRYSKC